MYIVYADDIVILSSSYGETHGLLEADNRHAGAVGISINASKTKVMVRACGVTNCHLRSSPGFYMVVFSSFSLQVLNRLGSWPICISSMPTTS